VLNVHLVGNKGKPVSVGYISATGKIRLDLTKMKSYMHDNRTETSFQVLHSQCQGTYVSSSGIPHVLEVSYLTLIFLTVTILTTAENIDAIAVHRVC
jgi:hypothetical protein